MVRKFPFALLCLLAAAARVEDYGGPLKNNFTYSVVYLPHAAADVNCAYGAPPPFSEKVKARDYTYNTIHVTGSLLFHGKDSSDNLRWISVSYNENGHPVVSVCWVRAGWSLYVGTGNTTMKMKTT
jgi:hypothetical protein